jgi:protein O-GlcNAc transferase
MIASSGEDYERQAIALALQPRRLAEIRQKLSDHRRTMPAFDTRLLTRHIEAAFRSMVERHRAGLSPAHLTVPQ